MKFEHVALNVPAPCEMARWYADSLGFRILRQSDTGTCTHFLGDDSGRVCLELYRNPAAPIPEYATQPPLVFHFAVATDDTKHLRARLVAAGASLLAEETLPDGSVLAMLRDPWGVALQLCQRAKPFPDTLPAASGRM